MTATREHRSVDERREQLLDATANVMAREGVAAATTRAITVQAGLPHGAFHYCFDSKSQLFAAVLERELQRSLEAAFQVPDAPMAPAPRLAAGLRAQFELTRSAPDRALALAELVSLSRRDKELDHLARTERTASLAAVTSNVEHWLASEGLQSAVPTDHLAALLIAISDGVNSSWLSDGDDATALNTLDIAATAIAALIKENPS